MEELQEALEDARYVHAINLIDGPRPITAWEDPSEDILREWKKKKLNEYLQDEKLSSKPFTFEWTLKSTLGFYMFSEFVKDIGEHYFHMKFIENVLRLRRSVGMSKGQLIREIYELSRRIPEKNVETGVLLIPNTKKKVEIYLEYIPHRPRLSTDELTSLTNSFIDHENQVSSIGLKGQVLNNIIFAIEALFLPEDEVSIREDDQSVISLQSSSSSRQSSTNNKVSGNKESLYETQTATTRSETIFKTEITNSSIQNLCTFDESIFHTAEQIVTEFLCTKYWSAFQASPEWTKFINYLWHQDKFVVDEDFFLMRVLGRGGFGLVNGTF